MCTTFILNTKKIIPMIKVEQEQRKKLIEKIKRVNDKHIIDEVYRLLNIDFDDTVYETNNDQKKAIKEAREQIKSGHTLSDKEVNKQISKWLNE